MESFNKVILVGNLTRDPELRYLPSGIAIAKISLAVNRKWRSETGERKEEVSFVEVDVFGKRAETIGQYFQKGSPILIEGRLRQDRWEDKNTGQNRSKLVVVLESFGFLDSGSGQRRNEGNAPGTSYSSSSSSSSSNKSSHRSSQNSNPPLEDDDVPF